MATRYSLAQSRHRTNSGARRQLATQVPMSHTIQIVVMLLVVIAAVGITAKRLQVPPAILLVITGVILALVPGLPTVSLAPEFVLLLVLPPVIYISAVQMSWLEFRFNLRPI